MVNKHEKVWPSSYVDREFHVKMTIRYHYTHITVAKIQNPDNTNANDVKQQRLSYIAGGIKGVMGDNVLQSHTVLS